MLLLDPIRIREHVFFYICLVTFITSYLSTPALQMGASSITPNGSVKNLGVIFDQMY